MNIFSELRMDLTVRRNFLIIEWAFFSFNSGIVDGKQSTCEWHLTGVPFPSYSFVSGKSTMGSITQK
jgi:hypothetical protein